MTERWRCFVAVPIEETVGSALSERVAQWRREVPRDALRWVDPGGWHLTLAFLGDVEPERLSETETTIAGIAAEHRPTTVATGRLGAFPRPGSARTLWYGVNDPGGVLTTMAGALVAALDLAPEEPFRPHITLARARRRAIDLRGWIEEASESAPTGRLPVESLHLVRSHLGTGPARYETLSSWPLGAAARV